MDESKLSLSSDLASHFDWFGFECFFCNIRILDLLRFGSYASAERLFHEMHIERTKILIFHIYSSLVYMYILNKICNGRSEVCAHGYPIY